METKVILIIYCFSYIFTNKNTCCLNDTVTMQIAHDSKNDCATQ